MSPKFYFQTLSRIPKKMNEKTLIYLNGGPGLNSNPESQILGPYLQSLGHTVYFWSEPSTLRPTQEPFDSNAPFYGAVHSIKKFVQKISNQSPKNNNGVILMAHSFSVQYLIELLSDDQCPIDELILFSPALDIHAADLNILELAARGLAEEGDTYNSQQILDLMPRLQEEFCKDKRESFLFAAKYTSLFSHYWQDKNLMQQYFSYLVGKHSFNLEEMLLMRQDMPKRKEKLEKRVALPTRIFFCEEDPITKPLEQLPKVSHYFTDARVVILKNSKHYPQLEQMEEIFHEL